MSFKEISLCLARLLRFFYVFDDPRGKFRRREVSVKRSNFAVGKNDSRSAIDDLISERIGEHGTVNIDQQVSDSVTFIALDQDQSPRLEFLCLAQSILLVALLRRNQCEN